MLEGVLRCQLPACGIWYPITRGVPRMLPVALRAGLTARFVARWQRELARMAIDTRLPVAQVGTHDSLHELKEQTIRNFGHEWLEYGRFGWEDPMYDLKFTRKGFLRRSLLEPGELEEAVVLDAGCGNGRYSFSASEYGAVVFGVDLGDGVDAAFTNTKYLSSVHIIQGDILALPFAPETFDIVFSIGVLHHTGDAKRATETLAGLLKPVGTITVHVYGKGNVIFEVVDRAIRNRTTKMSIQELHRLTERLFWLSGILQRVGVLRFVNKYLFRVQSHRHCIFDWYAAPVATHHTYTEVEEWLRGIGLQVICTNRGTNFRPGSRRASLGGAVVRHLAGSAASVTVRGRRAGNRQSSAV